MKSYIDKHRNMPYVWSFRAKRATKRPKVSNRRLFMKLTAVTAETKMGLSRLLRIILGYTMVRWKSIA